MARELGKIEPVPPLPGRDRRGRAARGSAHRALSRATEAAPYHHGALHELCSRRPNGAGTGRAGRADAARGGARSGRVHAAPTLFGDLTGLVSDSSDRLQPVQRGDGGGRRRRAPRRWRGMARAKATRLCPGAPACTVDVPNRATRHFGPSLQEAAEASFAGLAVRSARAGRNRSPATAVAGSSRRDRARLSLVHGFTMPLLDGRLFDNPARGCRRGRQRKSLLDAMLRARPSSGRQGHSHSLLLRRRYAERKPSIGPIRRNLGRFKADARNT